MTRFDGPRICPRQCDVCGAAHHWMEHLIDLDGVDQDDEERGRLLWVYGIKALWICKHCEAWLEYEPDEDDPQELWEKLHEAADAGEVRSEK